MNSPDDIWLCLPLVALFGLLFFLRVRFPQASKGSELAVLLSATAIFFSLCSYLKPHTPAASPNQQVTQVDHATMR
jgi:hypothetical protein